VLEGGRPDAAGARRLPFTFNATGNVGRLGLTDLRVGPVDVQRLELEVTDLGTDPGQTAAERFQRRRTRLHALTVRVSAASLDARVEEVRKQLGSLGVTNLHARFMDGYLSLRARAADGLAAADVSFRVSLVSAGAQLRALASHVRVHGHLPTPGPVVADRILAMLLGATDVPGVLERPHVRGLGDVEIDLISALLWNVMPPAGWRLPSIHEIELLHVRISRAAIEVAFGPSASRASDIGIRPGPLALAAAHDLMHSADQQLRNGHIEEAMRGYRALLAAGGPEQPQLLERILALAASRPAWFFDGLELARQALGRWPRFPASHAALASITLAQGDAREAATHLTQLAQQASADGDDDQAALAALAGARLLRVLDPKAATQLYELALEHDPSSAEAADALADRLADEQRWPELVRLLRARAVTSDVGRAVALRLRLADVFVHQLADPGSAQHELSVARDLAPEDPAVHEMTATILASSNPGAALEAWREVARNAEARGDTRSAARALAIVGDLLAKRYAAEEQSSWARAEAAWSRALELDPLQTEAIAGLATAAAARGDHDAAAGYYERLRGVGLPQHMSARYELMMARSLVQLGRVDEARASLRRATLSGGETAAEAHAVLAEIAEATHDSDHAAAELDTAITSFVGLATDGTADERLLRRAAELALARATLLDSNGQKTLATADYERAHGFAVIHAPELARDAARTMLSRAQDPAGERRWTDAVLATRPPAMERASLLVQRADIRRKERSPDVAASIADLHEALALTEQIDDPEAAQIRRRAYQNEADLLTRSGDQRARAQALTALARMAERASERVEVEAAAAAAWLAADEPATALPHGARAHAELVPDVPSPLRREVLTTLGEAAWRQRAWPDVIRAYRGLIDDPEAEPSRLGTFRYRLAVAADRSGDAALALRALAPLVEGHTATASDGAVETARGTAPDIRGQALRLYADLAERAGELANAATALEGFASVASESTPTSRADAMYRAGELFRRAERGDDAIRCLEAALRISDTHMPALDALELAWRERGDIERVSVILGRKVAATARHPQRQKSLISRLADLQDQLGRPDVALATHQRALEIDPTWRPSLRYVSTRLRNDGSVVAAAGGFAQLCGELPGDAGVDLAVVARERQLAAQALSDLVAALDDAQIEAVRSVAAPALERAAADPSCDVAAGLARLRGDPAPRHPGASEENTPSGRVRNAPAGALSLREAAKRSRAAGKLHDAFASLEAANHVSPGDQDVLRELVELATELEDHEATARHVRALATMQSGARRGESLLALADLYYDKLDNAQLARDAMREAADAFGAGSRRDSTLRMLASEAASHLAWDLAVDAISAVDVPRRTMADHVLLATALVRAGKPQDALDVITAATTAGKFDDGGLLLQSLQTEVARRAHYGDAAKRLKDVAAAASDPSLEPPEQWHAIGSVVGAPSLPQSGEAAALRDKLIAAHRDAPDDPDILLQLLAFLDGKDAQLRTSVLQKVGADGSGRAQAIACHELALLARNEDHDPMRAAALWQKAHRVDPSYTPVWMPLADALVAADELDLALELYEQIADSSAFDEGRRTWARERAAALSHDDAVVSGEIGNRAAPPASPALLEHARELAEEEKWREAIEIAERVAESNPADADALDLLEQLYLESGDITAASEAIGRQLVLSQDPDARASLWRRRAKLYRDALGRDAEAYRCLKEAHACAPTDPEIAYQLRTAAMVRGEWALVASLLYREIAAAPSPRDRGALHLELALIFQEKLDDASQAQVNFEQALAFDPTIPAAKAPLARRYEEVGRHHDSAKLFLEAAANARAAERPALLALAAKNRSAANAMNSHAGLAAQLEKAEAAGDGDAAIDLAHQLWRVEPGHPAAFRALAALHRRSGDLVALTELTNVRVTKAKEPEERARAWLEVARLAEDVDKPAEAARAYDLALVEDPGNLAALDARGSLAFKLGDWSTADLIYRDLSPEESVLGADDLALRRSTIAEQLGRHEEALALAKQASTLAPGRHDVMMRVQHLATAVGEMRTAIAAARSVLDLIPLDDDEASLRTRHSLVDLHRMVGEFDEAIVQLEAIVKDHPHHGPSIEQLAEMYIAKGDWPTATRYLYQLVPLAPTTTERAERLFRLGDALLVHLGDIDRADDVFLRASDLNPTHVPTLRRLLDVYWRADDPGALVEVASELSRSGALTSGPIAGSSLAQALVAAALCGETELARQLVGALGEDAPPRIAAALSELVDRSGRFELKGASTAIVELGRRGLLDMSKLRAAASGTPVEAMLAT
jgi:tetratricopeptide (TPR) repeat protein